MEFMGIRRENKLSLLLTPSGLPPPSLEVIITEGLTPLLYLYKPGLGWEMTEFPAEAEDICLEETEVGQGDQFLEFGLLAIEGEGRRTAHLGQSHRVQLLRDSNHTVGVGTLRPGWSSLEKGSELFYLTPKCMPSSGSLCS